MAKDIYQKLGVNKVTAKPGDLLSASKAAPMMKKYKKPEVEMGDKKDSAKEEAKESKKTEKLEQKMAKKRDKVSMMKQGKKYKTQQQADATEGMPMFKKPKLGSGKRFAQLTKKLASKGAENPKALAAYIGRKKYGAEKMASMAAKGRK